MTPQLGTDGKRIVYPIRGMVQGFRDRSLTQRRTTAYVLSLVLVAALVAGALLLAGYELESPATVIALALVAAVARRSQCPIDSNNRAVDICHSNPHRCCPLRPTCGCRRRSRLDAGRSGAGRPAGLGPCAAAEVGYVHLYPFHWRCAHGRSRPSDDLVRAI